MADGDGEAAWDLVVGNIRFFLGMAQNFSRMTSIPVNELLNEAMLELYFCALKFDPTRCRFITYAVYYALSAMQRYYMRASRNPVVCPSYLYPILRKCRQARNRFVAEHAIEPTVEDLVSMTGFRESLVNVFMFDSACHLRLDLPIKRHNEGGSREDTRHESFHRSDKHRQAQVEDISAKEYGAVFQEMLDILTPDQREIMIQRYVYDLPVKKIAQNLGKRACAVARSLERSKAKIREAFQYERIFA
jgi:RNA polymerase sigma factor (sigma-70 family)